MFPRFPGLSSGFPPYGFLPRAGLQSNREDFGSPPQFGAIFNHGIDVIIIPELCSGCGKCLDPCPVDCIYDDPDWKPAPPDWWDEPATDDPYR